MSSFVKENRTKICKKEKDSIASGGERIKREDLSELLYTKERAYRKKIPPRHMGEGALDRPQVRMSVGGQAEVEGQRMCGKGKEKVY